MHLSIMRNFAIKKKKNCMVSPAHRVIEPNILFLKKKKKKKKKKETKKTKYTSLTN